jgi:dTDP-4-amino-4,6-dideoxygalactose transaminase
LLEYLAANGIKSSILHQRNDFYTGFDTSRAVLPGTELVMNQLLALPCGYWLNDAQLKELIDKVTEFDALLI